MKKVAPLISNSELSLRPRLIAQGKNLFVTVFYLRKRQKNDKGYLPEQTFSLTVVDGLSRPRRLLSLRVPLSISEADILKLHEGFEKVLSSEARRLVNLVGL